MSTIMYTHIDLMNDRIDFSSKLPVLAHGDSWGSFGSVLPWLTGSLFEQFDFGKDVAIVDYAMPGQLLKDLPDPKRYSMFHLAMTLQGMPKWRALLVSGGGNDLIDWVRRGPGNDLSHRVLRYPAEWLPASMGPLRYVSQAGWVGLCQELAGAYAQFDAARNSYQPQMKLVTHVYDYMTPRYASAGVSGPWLAPAFQAAGIHSEDWPALAHALVDLFHDFLTQQIQTKIAGVVVLDTRGGSTPAVPGTTGPSNDWENEIHLTVAGYKKLAAAKCNGALTSLASAWSL